MSPKTKAKFSSFTFQVGQIGRIPSKQNGAEKESYQKYLLEFGITIDRKLKTENRLPASGSVYIFIGQLLKSEAIFRTCDVDNMLKSVLDVLKGKCYADDGQVSSLLIAKELESHHQDDFYFIGVKYLGKSSDPGNLNKEGLFEAKQLYASLVKK